MSRPVPPPVPEPADSPPTGPDLQTQLEEMLDAVWEAEANWRFDDRLDLSLKREGDVPNGSDSPAGS